MPRSGCAICWPTSAGCGRGAAIAEFDINQRPLDIAEALLVREPKIIGFGVYIWNVAPTTEVVAIIKRLRPDIKIILGGPEVSYETESQPIVQLADHVITGEADLKFAEVCRGLLELRAPHPDPLPWGEGRARDDCGNIRTHLESIRGRTC